MAQFGCPQCGVSLRVSDDKAGRKIKCPKCGSITLVPEAEAIETAEVVEPPPPPVAPRKDNALAGLAAAGGSGRTYRPPAVHVHVPRSKSVNGLGVAALVLGICACLGAWIPFLNIVSVILGALGLLFGTLGLLGAIIGRRSGIGFPAAGIIVCGVAMALAFTITGAAADLAVKSMDKATRDLERQRSALPDPVRPTLNPPPPPEPSPPKRTLIEAEFEASRPGDFGASLDFVLRNRSGKDIKSFTGAIHVYDQFDKHMDGLEVTRDEPLAAGQSCVKSGTWPLVGARTVRLLEGGSARCEFRLRQVIYGDGIRESFD